MATESSFYSFQIKLEHESRRLNVTFSQSNNKGFDEETIYSVPIDSKYFQSPLYFKVHVRQTCAMENEF